MRSGVGTTARSTRKPERAWKLACGAISLGIAGLCALVTLNYAVVLARHHLAGGERSGREVGMEFLMVGVAELVPMLGVGLLLGAFGGRLRKFALAAQLVAFVFALATAFLLAGG